VGRLNLKWRALGRPMFLTPKEFNFGIIDHWKNSLEDIAGPRGLAAFVIQLPQFSGLANIQGLDTILP
jgi:hypothetical protein